MGSKLDFSSSAKELLPAKTLIATIFISLILISLTILRFLSIIGLFLFRRFSRVGFLISELGIYLIVPVLAKILLSQHKTTMSHRFPWYTDIVGYLGLLCSIFILVVIFSKSGSYMFDKLEKNI